MIAIANWIHNTVRISEGRQVLEKLFKVTTEGVEFNYKRVHWISDNEVEFETPWCCPLGIFEAFSKQYNVTMFVEIIQEDFTGTLIFENGLLIKEDYKD